MEVPVRVVRDDEELLATYIARGAPFAFPQGDWPSAGRVIWESGPAGRGRVVEDVVEQEPLHGQTVAVEDDSIEGRQTVSFTPVEAGVEVEVALSYRIKKRSVFTPLVDLLFVRIRNLALPIK